MGQSLAYCTCAACAGAPLEPQYSGDGLSGLTGSKPVWSLEQVVGSLTRWDARWASQPIPYTFYNATPAHLAGNPDWKGFVSFTPEQRLAAKFAMDLIADVANLSFVERPDNGTVPSGANPRLTFSTSTSTAQYFTAYANVDFQETFELGDAHRITSAELMFNAQRWNGSMAPGPRPFYVLMHEILHAVGLPHPSAYNRLPNEEITYAKHAVYAQDSAQFTLMSYFSAAETGSIYNAFAQTPLLHDIAALQAIYGANTATRAGDTVYGYGSTAGRSVFDFAQNAKPILTIWDGGGTDILDFSQTGGAVSVDLNPGSFSDAFGMTNNIAIAHGVWIENARGGAGDDVLQGNAAANLLEGGGGNDRQFGAEGDDILLGQEGADYLNGGPGQDELHGGIGADFLEGGPGLDRQLGGDGDDLIGGQDGADYLNGGAGRDQLYGDAGADFLEGGGDDDRQFGGDGDDLIGGQDGADYLNGGSGRDQLYGDAGADFLEGGLDDDRQFGGDGDDTLGGQDGADYLNGGSGRDQLYGDAGADFLEGGADDDRQFGGDGDDLMGGQDGADYLNGGSGRDQLYGDAGADFLEGGADDDRLFGGDGDDLMGGQGGADLLDGGRGADALFGDAGDDRLVGGAGNDRIDGGDGFDVAIFSGPRSAYTFTVQNGVMTVVGIDGTDQLFGIESLQFDDGTVGATTADDWVM
jgi:serralysin